MLAAAEGGFCSNFSCCWDLRFLLCGSIVLALLTCFVRKIWTGRFLPDTSRFCGQSQAGPPLSTDLQSKMRKVLIESRAWVQEAFEERRDLRQAAPCRNHNGIPQKSDQDSIRQLLCGDTSCAICNKAATLARKLAYPRRLGFRFKMTPAPPVPTTNHTGCSNLLEASEPKKKRSSSREQRGARSPSSSSSQEECFSCLGPKAHFHSATSDALKVSFTSRRDYSSSAGHNEVLQCSLKIESEASSLSTQTEDEAFTKKTTHRRGRAPCRCHRSHKHRKKRGGDRGSVAAQRSWGEEGAAVDTPFLEEAVRAKLEWHLLGKRVQHAMGLPLSLLRSLRAFMPLAPDAALKKPSRNVAALIHPQALPFLRSEGTRAELERHLKKMVHLKRWGLPQKVSEALSHMQPSPGCRSPALSEKEDQGNVSRERGKIHQRAKDRGFGSAPDAPDWHFRKAAAPKPSNPLGGRHLHPSRVLFSQQKVRGMAYAHERMSFQGSLSTHSLARGLTSTSRQLPQMGSSATGAIHVTRTDLECLESHILRKRLHHQWGRPILIQRSLEQFLPAPPQSPTRLVLTRHFVREEWTSAIPRQLPFIHPDTLEQLNSHLRNRVVKRQWGLPRQVMDSLQMFAPVSLLSPEKPRAREVATSHLRGRRPIVRGLPSEKPPVDPERLDRSLKSQASGSLWEQRGRILQRHLAKRALEVQVNIYPLRVQYSQGFGHQATRSILPKVVPSEQKTVRYRTGDLLFMEQSAQYCIELNITHKNLTYKWGLPTIYTKSLAHLFQGMGALPPHLDLRVPRVLPGDFKATKTPFLASEVREDMEWHVKRKQVQHTWGLPVLVQRSLRCLLPAAPWLCHPRRLRPEDVSIAVQPPSFLSKEAINKLEANVRKRAIFQQLGLPKRILQSLRQLCPETLLLPARSTAPVSHPLPQRHPCSTASAEVIMSGSRRAKGTIHSSMGPKGLQKMKTHLARRSVEMRLGQPPSLVRVSWRLASLSVRQSLPRPIPPGQESPQPRNSFLPFSRLEDLHQIGLSVCRRYLSSLWGLGLRYVEALTTMVVPAQAPRPQRTKVAEFPEVGTPFLPPEDRDALELHVRTRRLQHQWGVPAFLQRSLKAFAEPCPLLPAASLRAEIPVGIMQREFLFLPHRIRSHLEMHVQKMKLHRHWGLPSRVLESLKPMRPGSKSHGYRKQEEVLVDSSSFGAALEDSSCSAPTGSYANVRGSAGRPKRDPHVAAAPPPVFSLLGTTNLEKIKLRLAKKCMEEQLGAFPAVVKLSWWQASLCLRQPLPKLILPGQRTPQARTHLPSFGRREDMDRISLAMKHKHLMALWGLGTHYVGALGGITPRISSLQPHRPRREAATLVFSEVRILFLTEQEREILEQQVKRKRIHHLWGFPAIVQRSIRSFMREPPSLTVYQRITVTVCIQQREPSFLSPASCCSLELHIQNIKLQHRWGMPGRVLEPLKIFGHSGDLEKTGRERRPARDRQLPPPPPSPQEQLTSTGALDFATELYRQLKRDRDIQRKMEEQEEEEEEEGEGEGREEKGQEWEGETSTLESLQWKERSAEQSISLGRRYGKRRGAHPTVCRFPAEPSVSYPAPHTSEIAVGSRTPKAEKKIAVRADTSLRITPPQRESWGEYPCPAPILLKGEVMLSQPRKDIDKKISLIGAIVEKKLYMQDGLQIWLHHQERHRGMKGEGECSRLSEDQGVWQEEEVSTELHKAEKDVTVEGEEPQSDFSSTDDKEQKSSSREQKSSSRERKLRSKEWTWSNKERKLSSKERKSRSKEQKWRSKKRKSSSRERKSSSRERKSSSRERKWRSKERKWRSKERKSSSRERKSRSKERKSRSKERKSRSKERKSSSKERTSSSKERKSSSKERKSSSKERKSRSKERKSRSKERKSSSKERKSSSKERKSSSKERKSRSKERKSCSKKWKLTRERSTSKEQTSSSRRSSSKEERSRSSSGKRGSKIKKWLFSSIKKKPESQAEHTSSRQRSRSRGQSERRQGGSHQPRAQPQHP